MAGGRIYSQACSTSPTDKMDDAFFTRLQRPGLAKGDLMEAVCKPIRFASLVKLKGADNPFRAGKKGLVDATRQWTEKIVAGKIYKLHWIITNAYIPVIVTEPDSNLPH